MSLIDMTYDKWLSMPEHQREAIRDNSDLSAQLCGLEGWRVEVVTESGETRRFYVGKSTGWKPCHLEIHNRRSMGGIPADKHYASVKRLYRR